MDDKSFMSSPPAETYLLNPIYPSGLSQTFEDRPSLLTVDDVQKYLNRSRASVYRYTNTNREVLNSPYNPQKLNPEIRRDKDDPLQFRPQEVQRFAEEVLGLNPTIQVQTPTENLTNALLGQILQELKAIHTLLELQTKD
ncbi:MAG: helix-turn-helix domain-containing protein [Nodosilinea sp. LVE1205-7]|jgi:hypothetical protein